MPVSRPYSNLLNGLRVRALLDAALNLRSHDTRNFTVSHSLLIRNEVQVFVITFYLQVDNHFSVISQLRAQCVHIDISFTVSVSAQNRPQA